MTPYRDRGKGTWVLDRVFKGVGRIKRASGTNDRAMFRNLDGMLTDLYARGRLDILNAIKSGALAPMQVWDKRRRGVTLPDVGSMASLPDAVEAWLDTYGATYPDRAKHLVNLASGLNRMLVGAKNNDTVHDMPRLLMLYKASCRDKHSTFNHAKAYAMSFLADTVGTDHTTYREVQAIRGYPKGRKREPVLVTPSEARQIVRDMKTFGPEMWALFLTGMNPKEYWGRWELQEDHIAVFGTKREAREFRKVPLVEPVAVPSVKEWRRRELSAALRKVRPDMLPKDGRNNCTRWMLEAGILELNVDAYMGWSTSTMRGLYGRDWLFRDVAEDGAKLRVYLGVIAHKMEVVK